MENGSITGNTAQNGGGIHTGSTTYSNLTTGSGAAFSNNTASTAFVPLANAAVLHPTILFASASIANHPLNNYDINFISIYKIYGGFGKNIEPVSVPGGTDTVLSLERKNEAKEQRIDNLVLELEHLNTECARLYVLER